MRVSQVILFLAFLLGAGGTESPNGEYQMIAVGIMIVALVVLLVISRKEEVWTRHCRS